MMQVDLIHIASQYCAMKMNMYLIKNVLLVRQGLTMPRDDASSGTNTTCDAICSENYYVSDHKCIECDPGTYNAQGDDASGPDTYCDNCLSALNAGEGAEIRCINGDNILYKPLCNYELLFRFTRN